MSIVILNVVRCSQASMVEEQVDSEYVTPRPVMRPLLSLGDGLDAIDVCFRHSDGAPINVDS